MQPVVAVESVQQVKGARVRLHDVAETSAFPHLITVPSLDVGEPGTVVMVHGVKVQLFIPGKDVCLAVVPTMAVAEKDKTQHIKIVKKLCFILYAPFN